jgi:hypothetical protein
MRLLPFRLEVTCVIEGTAACGVMHCFLRVREMSPLNTFFRSHGAVDPRLAVQRRVTGRRIAANVAKPPGRITKALGR